MIETQELEHTPVQSRKRLTSKQVKWLVGGLLIALTAGYLIFSAASGSVAYYVTIDKVQHMEPSGRNVRVAGNVVGESIVWEARDLRLAFEMVDESGQLAVRYKGPRPDMFRDQAEVVIEGKLADDGVFEARTMLLKCPSKYEEAD